jgi:structural maintenance of chromosome 4
MRLRHLKELIHNSANHYNIDKATVSVTFNEIEEVDPIEITQSEDGNSKLVETITISRVVYSQDSGSDYEMNGKTCTRADIVDLLKQKGMDMNNNRFLILQGEVEQISLMKPLTGKKEEPGLLEYLEDIIGSHVYVEQITAISEKYSETKRTKENEMLLLHDLRKELDSMEEHKERAVKFIEIEKRLLCLNHVLLHCFVHESRARDVKAEEKIQLLEAQLVAQKKQFEEVFTNYKSDFMMVKKYKSEKEKKNEQLEQVKRELEKINSLDQDFNAKIKMYISDIMESQSSIEKNKQDMKKINDSVATLRNKLPTLESDLMKKDKECKELVEKERSILSKIEPQINKIKERIREIKERLAPYERDAKRFETQRKAQHTEIENLNKKENRLVEDLDKASTEFQEQCRIIEKLQSKKQNYEGQQSQEKQRLEYLKNKMRDLTVVEEKTKEQLNSLEYKINEKKSAREDAVQKNFVLSYLLQNKEITAAGRVYGRIGDLGSIDPQFDIAISAVSNQFNNILLDHTETAKNCIKFLKRDQIGCAQFTTLNRIETFRQRMKVPFHTPPNSRRLFDLVTVSEEDVRVAYYQILQDTLVCKDLDTAQVLAYQGERRYKVVTFDGYICNPDGTMSGGGKPKRGMVGSKIKVQKSEEDDETIESLSKKKEELYGVFKDNQQELSNCRLEQTKIMQELNRLPNTLRTLEQDISQENHTLATCMAKKQSLERTAQDNSIMIAKQEAIKELEKIDAELRKLELDQNKHNLEIKDLEEKIIETGGNELKDVKAKVNTTKEEHRKLEEAFERGKAELQKSQAVVVEKEKENEEIAKKILTLEEEKAKVVLKKDEMEAKFVEKAKQEKELNDTIAAIDKDFVTISANVEKLVIEVQKVKDSMGERKKEIEEQNKLKEQFKHEVAKLNEDIESNKNKYLQFIANFSILDELRKMENTQPQEENDEQERGSASNSKRKKVAANLGLDGLTPDKPISSEEIRLLGINIEEVKAQLAYAKNDKVNLTTDTDIIEIYQEKLMAFIKKNKEYNMVAEDEHSLRNELNTLKERRRIEFMSGFTFISKTLKSVYQTITNGGDADLELIDSYDPFSEGIMFSVRPPNKSWKHMSKLSGGEKTLSSLSLIFALHYYKPTPIYFMDEIDAALDFRNVEVVAKFIKERTKNAQFIVISLRNHMFELANQLVGIYKVNDTTKTVSIYPNDLIPVIEDDLRKDREQMAASKHSQSFVSRRISRRNVFSQEESFALPESKRKSLAANVRNRLSKDTNLE